MLLDFWYFLTAWYNLPFTVLLGLGLFVAGLQLSGLGDDEDPDQDLDDADIDTDLDQDFDHEMSHEIDHDLDQDFDDDFDPDGDGDSDSVHDAAHDGDGDADNFSLLSFIGVGKVPMLVVFLILFVTIGLLGWLMNGTIQSVLGTFPSLLILVTLPGASVAGTLLTSRVTRTIGLLVPPLTTTASRAQALVGMTGTVTSPYIDETYGMVHLRDLGSTLISIFAVTDDDQPIPRGEKVLLVAYDPAKRRYRVSRK